MIFSGSVTRYNMHEFLQKNRDVEWVCGSEKIHVQPHFYALYHGKHLFKHRESTFMHVFPRNRRVFNIKFISIPSMTRKEFNNWMNEECIDHLIF